MEENRYKEKIKNMKKVYDAAKKLLDTDDPDGELLELLSSEMNIYEKVATIRMFVAMLLNEKSPSNSPLSIKRLVKTFKPVLLRKEDLLD